VLVKVARHKKGVKTEEMKQYVAWYLEQHHQEHLGVRVVLIFDFTDAGIMNMVRMDTDWKLTTIANSQKFLTNLGRTWEKLKTKLTERCKPC